jgi:short-subunit dehydrogenase
MKRAIIIGASSGIGRELAKILSNNGYILGLAARRITLLETLQEELPNKSIVKQIDIAATGEAIMKIKELFQELEDPDLIIICSGTGHLNPELDPDKEIETINVNVTGFTAMMNASVHYFMKRGKGHLVGISSIAALRGGRIAPAYNASKAFVSNYMEGIRCKVKYENRDIIITDIRPGFVDTDMAKGEGLFWVIPTDTAAKKIYKAIKQRKAIAVIDGRWIVIAFLLRIMPDWLYCKL